MKKKHLFVFAALWASAAMTAPPETRQTEVSEGYVCSVARAALTGNRGNAPTALAFKLSTEPECKGEWLEMNYACPTGPRVLTNVGLCAKGAAFSMAEQAMIHDELLHAAQRNLPVDVIRGPCLSEDPLYTCFVHVTVYNLPHGEE